MKVKYALVLVALSLSTVFSVNAGERPKNIIMIVGDGMGPAFTSGYRYFADNKNTREVETTVFDRLLVGMASTYPSVDTGYVTDSASGATAMATGIKTYNEAIGVDVNKQPHQTVLEFAKSLGMQTGLAVTLQINHATPAAYVSHNENRDNYDEIADSYFDDKLSGQFKVDVMLGGGWKYFIRDDRNLVSEFKQAGYQYVDDLEQLGSVEKGKPLLGLFADKGLPWALDSKDKRRLGDLVQAAVRQLENDKGYFLLVEASQIDWAGHANDVASAMAEMHDLALTLEWLENYVDSHSDTLMVLTADHSTGGLSLGRDKNPGYHWDPHWLTQLNASPETIARQLVGLTKPAEKAASLLGFNLNQMEVTQLNELQGSDNKDFYIALKNLLDTRSNSGWTSHNHDGVDVQVFAKGKGSELFSGHLDNTQIAKNIFSLLGKN